VGVHVIGREEGHHQARDVPFQFANPLQRQAQNYMEAPTFDGQPKNWPRFIRKWNEYVRVADPDNRASNREKALIFERCMPQNLKMEMQSHMAQGNSFSQWLNRLTVRYGNAGELERKQWREMHLQYKGKLDVADWRSFMACFLECQTKVKASNEEALTVLNGAVPTFIQGWINKFKVKQSYREKKVRITLSGEVAISQVHEAVVGWTGQQPKSIKVVQPGEFELSFPTSLGLEAILALNGKQIHRDGTRLKVEVPPLQLNLMDIMEHVAEILECQPESGSGLRDKQNKSSVYNIEVASDSESEGERKIKKKKQYLKPQSPSTSQDSRPPQSYQRPQASQPRAQKPSQPAASSRWVPPSAAPVHTISIANQRPPQAPQRAQEGYYPFKCPEGGYAPSKWLQNPRPPVPPPGGNQGGKGKGKGAPRNDAGGKGGRGAAPPAAPADRPSASADPSHTQA
jgi:hypothetical protein